MADSSSRWNDVSSAADAVLHGTLEGPDDTAAAELRGPPGAVLDAEAATWGKGSVTTRSGHLVSAVVPQQRAMRSSRAALSRVVYSRPGSELHALKQGGVLVCPNARGRQPPRPGGALKPSSDAILGAPDHGHHHSIGRWPRAV